MTRQTFTDAFRERVRRLEAEAREAGISLAVVCREAGVSRATPDRWRRETPKTIRLLDQMEAVVARLKAAQGKK